MILSDLYSFVGYKVVSDGFDVDGNVRIYLDRSEGFPSLCNRCGHELGKARSRYRLKLRHLPVFERKCYLLLWRYKRDCKHCKKICSEQIPFISPHSPHLTKAYCHWMSKLCEITTVKEAAEFCSESDSTMWRLDKATLEDRLKTYRIPHARKIAVDEVCSRRANQFKGESRNQKYFTVITDLEAKRVIWVSHSRNKEALDEYFQRIGPEGRGKIKVITSDQHPGYAKSIEEYVPHARHVLDKFHLMRNFEEAINECRKFILKTTLPKSKVNKLAQGKYRFIFLKKSSLRTLEEKQHLEEVMKENQLFYQLELIKERMFSFFNPKNPPKIAKKIMIEIRDWIYEAGFPPLKRWLKNFLADWPRIINYFYEPVTNAMAEGFNNVIKTLKRKAYGYRNMEYFALKVMQKCGYLSSKYVYSDTHQGYTTFNHHPKITAA